MENGYDNILNTNRMENYQDKHESKPKISPGSNANVNMSIRFEMKR